MDPDVSKIEIGKLTNNTEYQKYDGNSVTQNAKSHE